MEGKKVFNLNTERIKRNFKKRLETRPDKSIDNQKETIDKAVRGFTKCMITVIPKLVDQLDKALDDLKKAVKEASINK